eukprot:5387203-Pyramimonas_sp.AAC.1
MAEEMVASMRALREDIEGIDFATVRAPLRGKGGKKITSVWSGQGQTMQGEHGPHRKALLGNLKHAVVVVHRRDGRNDISIPRV